jgi:hypothetical protein
MAEVYRARDTRLGRDVALKIVNEALAGDPELVRRFEQEARLAGSLNHPNLVAVYDVGVQDGAAYFITELLKGESLRERLSHGRIPIQTALDWGSQLAQGLAAAHGQGIIHRDVKPENVFVTSDGHVKLLDFGIAKLAEVTRADCHHGMLDATVTSTGGGTGTGAILGTPAYMSPEQVQGEPVDARTDIFSLGAVLYEMLSGQRAFPGGSLVETGHAILHDEPPPLPEEVPPAVAEVVRRCLEKEPTRRLQSASDLAFALDLLRGPSAAVRGRPAAAASAKRLRRLIAIAGAVLLVGATGALVHAIARTGRPALPEIEQVTFQEGAIENARFTPEGRFVLSAAWGGEPEEVFTSAPGDPQLHPLGLKEVRLLGVSNTGELAVMMRPPAQITTARGMLARVPGTGGVPRELSEDVVLADWSPQGELTAVRFVGANYRIERPLGTPVYEVVGGNITHLRVSPDGANVAFVHRPVFGRDEGRVMLLDTNNAVRALTRTYQECDGLAWSPSGTEVWFTAGDVGPDTLRAAPLHRAEYEVYRSTGDMRLQDIAADGTVLFSLNEQSSDISLLDRSGSVRRSLTWYGGSRAAALSDDGQLLAFSDWRTRPLSQQVFVRRTDGSAPKMLGEGQALDLSADKKTVLAKQGAGLVLLPVGAGTPLALPTPGLEVRYGRLFRDGKRVVILARPVDSPKRHVFVLDAGSDAKPRPISETAVTQRPFLFLSPDQRWVATLDADGVVLVLPIAGGAPIRLPGVGPPPGAAPVGWSAEGDLWLRSGWGSSTQLRRVDPATRQVKELRELSSGDTAGATVWNVVITPDGERVAFSPVRTRSRLFLMRGAGPPKN